MRMPAAGTLVITDVASSCRSLHAVGLDLPNPHGIGPGPAGATRHSAGARIARMGRPPAPPAASSDPVATRTTSV